MIESKSNLKRQLVEDVLTRRLSRRDVLQRGAAAGFGMAAISVLLAGCGDDDDSDDEASNEDQATTSSGESDVSESESTSASSDETEVQSGSGESTETTSDEPTDESSADQSESTEVIHLGGTLRVVYAEEPKNLHPQITSGSQGWYVLKQIYDGLLNCDENGELVPGLATDFPEQPDDVTMIFTLRDDVTFHNGKPFTADDMVWTFDRLLGKIEGQEGTSTERYKGYIESVEKLDDYKFQINLRHPTPDFDYMLGVGKYMLAMQKDATLEAGDDYGLSVAVGTGPFKFKEWIRGDRLSLVRNEDYWGEPALVDEVEYKAIPEAATMMASLKGGEADILLEPPLKDVAEFEDDPDYAVQTHTGGKMIFLGFNTSQEPFTNVKIRQAIAYAIDRQEIVDAIYYGYASIGQGLLPPWNESYNPDLEFYPYDPDKAKQLLTEAGYGDDSPLEFDLDTTNATEYVDLSTLIQAQLQRIGVKVNVFALDKSAFLAKTSQQVIGEPNPNSQAQLYRLIYGFVTTDYSARSFHPDSSLDLWAYNQAGGAQNPEVEELLDEVRQTVDDARQKELHTELSKLINEDMPMLHLVFQDNVNISSSQVHDLGITVLDVMPFKEVWIEE